MSRHIDRTHGANHATRELLARIAMVASTGLGTYYLYWRFRYSLNPHALWLSLPVWLAEVYGVVSGSMFFFMVWSPRHRPRPAAAPGSWTVDVLIPTYNEPLWIVKRTLLGALAMNHSHLVHLLDDGNRPEMRELAAKMGVNYIRRISNEDAKAGNLNNALTQTSGEFIAIFDADHVPMPDFLEWTLGHFEDPLMAFVQTPQEFYNLDSFQHRVDTRAKTSWHEQALFYDVIQPGKDRCNAAFFCGSSAVIRRSALLEVGGFAIGTVTEDLHTSIRLHAAGWRSAYVAKPLAYGLAPASAQPYHTQRLRWGQGAMQVFRMDNPLLKGGLSISQRINYLASMTTYFDAVQKTILYLAPALFLLTGILPIKALTVEFLVRFGIYYSTSILAFKLASRGHGLHHATEGYNLIRFYTYLKALQGLFSTRRLRFAVTGKENQTGVPLAMATPAIAVTAVTAIAIIIGSVRYRLGFDYSGPVAFFGNLGWASWQAGIGLWAVHTTLKKVDGRRLYRAKAGLPVRWRAGEQSGIGVMLDVHEEGALIQARSWPTGDDPLEIQILWAEEMPMVRAQPARVTRNESGVEAAVSWVPDSLGQEEALVLLTMCFTQRKAMEDMSHPRDRIGMADFSRLSNRKQHRLPSDVPVEIGETGVWGVLEDQSAGGALLFTPKPPCPGALVTLKLWGEEEVRASVVRVTELELAPYSAFRVGLKYVAEEATLGPAA